VTVKVLDPFDAAADPALPTVALALDPKLAARKLRRLVRLTGPGGVARLRAIRVTRHKPGRRCVVEYDLDVEKEDAPKERVTLIGKVRSARYGNVSYRLLSAFWEAGFDSGSADQISVPEPIGTVAKFRMWLQRKVPGLPATDALAGPDGLGHARRIAEAAHKIHQARVRTSERHTMADELRILDECFARLSDAEPQYVARLRSLLAGCERLATETPPSPSTGIHRDFYADQVIVDGGRLHVIDFDLYCEGEAALDIGNFIGHMTEQSLRELGRPDALAHRERALEDRFVELTGERVRQRVRTYATLTLARHVYLSTTFPDRRPFTRALLDLCEERLGVARLPVGSRRCA
jgi:hypothetical protein